MNLTFALKVRLRYLLTAHYRKGHWVHSPFAYSVLRNVIFEKSPYYSYDTIEKIRIRLESDNTPLHLQGTNNNPPRTTTIGNELLRSGKATKYARLLQRLCASCNAKHIIELGTNMGVTTMYLAANDSRVEVMTFEKEKELINIAKHNFKIAKFNNIKIVEGDIDNNLAAAIDSLDAVDMMFFDANHTYEATMRYYHTAKAKTTERSIFVIDDIHWSPQMEQAWNEIVKDKDIRLSIDIFSMGIIWFNPEIPKQHYVVAY